MEQDLTLDSEILGDLPERIRQKKPVRHVKTPQEYEKELENLISQHSVESHDSTFITVSEYVLTPKKPKRVPRMWWGWTILLYRRAKKRLNRLSS